MKKTKPCLFTWGFDENTGNPYIDNFTFIKGRDDQEALKAVNYISMRQRFQHTKLALFHVPKDFTIEDIEEYVKSAAIPQMREEVLKKLKGAEVKFRDILRTAKESSAAEGILQLADYEEEGDEYG